MKFSLQALAPVTMGQPGGLVLSLAVLLVLYSVAMSAMSQFMVENNSLRVISPDNLKEKKNI